MEYATIASRTAQDHLDIFGAFHPGDGDHAPIGCRSIVLLGPSEPGFWPHVLQMHRVLRREADPLDRWSARVIGKMAADLDAEAVFPFGGPPYQPFISWAQRSGRAWASPVTLLVHDMAGMMVSYRGALAFGERLDLPAVPDGPPCQTCAQPCLTACPVGALSANGYDLAACHAYLETEPGRDCMEQGCAVRRACPISQSYGRLSDQSAFHMRSFHS